MFKRKSWGAGGWLAVLTQQQAASRHLCFFFADVVVCRLRSPFPRPCFSLPPDPADPSPPLPALPAATASAASTADDGCTHSNTQPLCEPFRDPTSCMLLMSL